MDERICLKDVQTREILPGFSARFVHTSTMTLAYWSIEANAALPNHSHLHEQVVNMLEGEFELIVDGRPHRLVAGDIFVLKSNVPHAGRAITDCRILDVFCPVREDYQDA